MKWVFIFDQINRIFDRPDFQKTKDVGDLPFPFLMMTRALKPGRIISIICGSANNVMSHREYHEGFKVFEHPTHYDKDEIEILYPPKVIAKWDWEEMEYFTGRVPWYFHRWTKDYDNFLVTYGMKS
jgi:hypothetical protein